VGIILNKQGAIPNDLLALGLGSAAAVITRIALLAYIDATSFPAASVLYISPASPFVILFTAVGIYAGCGILLRGKNFHFLRLGEMGEVRNDERVEAPALKKSVKQYAGAQAAEVGKQ
jgi:hypothetical protein